jgi:hypothetical protein
MSRPTHTDADVPSAGTADGVVVVDVSLRPIERRLRGVATGAVVTNLWLATHGTDEQR